MRKHLWVSGFLTLAATSVFAQKPPAIRQIGRLEHISADSLASVATALHMPGGRVLVNDQTSRRILLFDSTLAHPTVIADTTSATAKTYGRRQGGLIRYRGDSALFLDPASLSMFVIGPTGTVVRVIAVPRPTDAAALLGGAFGIPGVDANRRLVYVNGLLQLPSLIMLNKGEVVAKFAGPYAPNAVARPVQHTDSTFILRVDFETLAVDTVTSIKVPKVNRDLKGDAQGLLTAIQSVPDPLPLVDGWAMLPDGSVAIVRGRDYHVDWLDPNGRWSSTPKMAFDWVRVDDARKQVLIDSAVAAMQASFEQTGPGRSAQQAAPRTAGGDGGGRGAGSGGDRVPNPNLAPNVATRPELGDLPDYVPPFTLGAVRADAEGNVWIRTSKVEDGRPVYDVVNRKGEIIDRVQLPPFRTVAGFGPGVIYMAVKDSGGRVHLERARMR